MKLSNYSLNYSRLIASGGLTIADFLGICPRARDWRGRACTARPARPPPRDPVRESAGSLLDQGLSLSMFTVSTNFGVPADRQAAERDQAREAIQAAAVLGAPLLRVFAGSSAGDDRAAGWARAVAGVRQVCVDAAEVGLPVGLQNHNHGAHCAHRGRRAAVRQGGRSPQPDGRARLRPVSRQPGGQRRGRPPGQGPTTSMRASA